MAISGSEKGAYGYASSRQSKSTAFKFTTGTNAASGIASIAVIGLFRLVVWTDLTGALQ